MRQAITRRNALAGTVSAAAGMVLGATGSADVAFNFGNEIGRSDFWKPGPDRNRKKNPTPGETPVLLSAILRRPSCGVSTG